MAWGFSQEFRVDYRETFAPVIRLDALRLILAVAVIKGWDMQQLDIKSAYLHGKLEEEIFMTQPPGFEADPNLVCKLIHSLYGLKQSGRAWYLKFRDVLSKYGFHQLEVKHCLYKRDHNGKTQIISAWIDNLILIGDDPEETADMKRILPRNLKFTISGNHDS